MLQLARHQRFKLPLHTSAVAASVSNLDVKKEPCTSCYLIEFVPQEHTDEAEACHFIPLNERGDTVASLCKGDHERMYSEVESWLVETISRLEREVRVERAAGCRHHYFTER
jgi:hypothetical protein